MDHIFVYIIYGLIGGLSQMLPVSDSAHAYLFATVTGFDTMQPLMMLGIHLAALVAVVIHMRHRIGHIQRELRIASLPLHKRNRQPDIHAVLDAKTVFIGLVPLAAGIFLTQRAYSLMNLPLLCLALLISGVVIYIPQYVPGGNRGSRHMSRLDGLLLGLCNALAAIPGISRMGTVLSCGLVRKCDSSYMLDLVFLILIPTLFGLMITDAVVLFTTVSTTITLMYVIQCALSMLAAFGGAFGAIALMRYLTANVGYAGFAYYSWGLGFFSFILYLFV